MTSSLCLDQLCRDPNSIASLTHTSFDQLTHVQSAANFRRIKCLSLKLKCRCAPGDAQPFQTRLASPPTEGREVVVRFFTRRDAAGGAH